MASQAHRLRDHAYSSFTEKLLSRDIQPGQIVSQRELVELTGMPLGAIREMIPRLEADGLIRTVPKRGPADPDHRSRSDPKCLSTQAHDRSGSVRTFLQNSFR